MRKRDKTTKTNTEIINETGVGKFTFHNGDVYEGEYRLNYNRHILVKEGRGTYITDNFDTYNAVWEDDTFSNTDIHIKYNNDAQFRGRVDSNGTMNGLGTYMFPDGSSVEAIWVDNVPTANIIYREPQGFAWMVKDMSRDSVSFASGNHFWDAMLSAESSARSTESFEQKE